MKKIHNSILILTTSLFLMTSCGKTPINGKLDGMWHLTEISYADSSAVNDTESRIYYSIQLELISLRSTNSNIEYLGRFNHSEDSLIISEFRIKENENTLATVEELKPFGLNALTTRFAVERLGNKNMILKSNYARLYFKKF